MSSDHGMRLLAPDDLGDDDGPSCPAEPVVGDLLVDPPPGGLTAYGDGWWRLALTVVG